MGTLRRAALSAEPLLNVSCSAVFVWKLAIEDVCAFSHVGDMV